MPIGNDTIITKEHLQIYLNIIGAQKIILNESINQTKILKKYCDEIKLGINKILPTLNKEEKLLSSEMIEYYNCDIKIIENYFIIFKSQRELINQYEQRLIYDLQFFEETYNYKYLGDIKKVENLIEEMKEYEENFKKLANKLLMK